MLFGKSQLCFGEALRVTAGSLYRFGAVGDKIEWNVSRTDATRSGNATGPALLSGVFVAGGKTNATATNRTRGNATSPGARWSGSSALQFVIPTDQVLTSLYLIEFSLQTPFRCSVARSCRPPLIWR